MRRIIISALVIILFTSCDLLTREDTYVDATVGEAIGGSVESETATYKLHNPEMIAVEKDYALLRDGNQLAILSGDGFEDTLAALEGLDYSLLVKNWGNPYPHFRLRGFQVGEIVRPISFVLADSELPSLWDKKSYGLEYYEVTDLAAWQESPPDIAMVDKQILIGGDLERLVEVVEVTAPAEDEEVAEAGEETTGADGEAVVEDEQLPRTEERVRYFIVNGDVRVEIAPVAENGVNLLLEGIENQKRRARYGGFMTKVNSSRERSSTGSYGIMQLGVFDFAGKICVLR